MNSAVANLILARVEAANLGWLDKVAGLTRAITFSKGKTPGTWPIACTVSDPLACNETQIAELLPDENYNSILFFEGETFPVRVKDLILGASFTSRLRIVVWMNCSRLGGNCDCGGLAAQNLITAIESSRRGYASGPLIDIKHTVIGGGPARGREIFSRYTFNEARSQYLHYPFDFFALDIETTFRVAKGCEDQLDPDNINCWPGPTLIRRRYAKDFTCEELQDPTTGLTAEQLGADCLDCEGSGDCPTPCEVIEGMDASEIVACVPGGDRPALLCEIMDTAEATAEVIVVCLDGAGKTAAVEAIICDAACPYDGIIQLDGIEVGTFGPFDPCVDNTLNIILA